MKTPPRLIPRQLVAKFFKMPPLMYTQMDFLSHRRNQTHSEFIRSIIQASIEKEYDNYPDLRHMAERAHPKEDALVRVKEQGEP